VECVHERVAEERSLREMLVGIKPPQIENDPP
jgi:hypothetical protein